LAFEKKREVARILVVDDEEPFRNLIRERLQDEYEIIDTAQPADALALALQHKPDAIVLDLSMPEFSGFELCQTLSSLSYTRAIPIFIISGETAAKYAAFCRNLGAAEYFEKPVDFNELRARLAVALKAKQPGRPAEVSVRLRMILKLLGTDRNGQKFDLVTTTDGVSASGFSCSCPTALQRDSVVDVLLLDEEPLHVGQARAIRVEWRDTPVPRYVFRFVTKPNRWVLQ
jgi:DNA-binding response OmpR family regulator